MLEKDPTTYSIITYAWVVILSAWGGIVAYIHKLKHESNQTFSIGALIGEVLISGFVGVITFWGCEQASFAPLWTAALVGISGHMGSRALFPLEEYLTKFIKSKFGHQ